MSRILVLGGYGGFGSTITDQLRRQGHDVLVAGRSLERAKRFCQGRTALVPIRLDRRDIVDALAEHRPDAVVDASGPFQSMDLALPRACIAAGIPYCDIADSTDFVCAIALLDAEAKAAGVPIIAGASSVPALSGAAIRELAAEMSKVTAVEIAISASNQASAGPAVTAAILSQVGQPFAQGYGIGENTVFGWQDRQRAAFTVTGSAALTGRSVYLVDVPDVRLVPGRLPGMPLVSFRAGTEFALHNWTLWLLSWPVRWGWLASLLPLNRWITPLQRLTAWFGGDRSAMIVRLFGVADHQRIERRWTLLAEKGDGPKIPALSAPLIVDRMLAGQIRPGARDAGNELSLTDFEPSLTELSVRHERTEIAQSQPLYQRIMGADFLALPKAVRQMHSVLREASAEGEAEVTGATNPIGRLIARMMGFPPAGRCPLRVLFAERDGAERWQRQFGQSSFASNLSQSGEWLTERFGLIAFDFALHRTSNGLAMQMRRWSVCYIPLPLAWAPQTEASEWAQDGWFHFDVLITLPMIGRLVHYRGRLQQRQ